MEQKNGRMNGLRGRKEFLEEFGMLMKGIGNDEWWSRKKWGAVIFMNIIVVAAYFMAWGYFVLPLKSEEIPIKQME